jgi:NAD(P)-dependent dehydrogenase (short-subunit alcohol dehydrogenase family)
MEYLSVPDLFCLQGKVAIVTGASGYLGEALAKGLAEAGASVVVTSRSLQRAEKSKELLPKAKDTQHLAVELDHMNADSIDAAFNHIVDCMGQVDILVNNAHEATRMTWKEASSEDFDRQLANATGYFLCARALREHVTSRGAEGSIIMLSSMYGIVSSDPSIYLGIGPGNPVAYQVLKSGIIQLTRHLAVHWAGDRVRVNCISPGPFANRDTTSEELVARLERRTPLNRIGSPNELRGAVVFLASGASSYVTGHNLIVDGGWTIS